jgi:hypothetical protein
MDVCDVIRSSSGDQAPSRGVRTQQTARAGEHFVAAELHKRGAYAVAFAGNMPKIDILACNARQSRMVTIQVKTKQGGRAWQTDSREGRAMDAPARPLEGTTFWILVDLGQPQAAPRYWIVPEWWIRNDIARAHQAYLERHGGRRPSAPQSTHHAMEEHRVTQWEDRWDILDIFAADPRTDHPGR